MYEEIIVLAMLLIVLIGLSWTSRELAQTKRELILKSVECCEFKHDAFENAHYKTMYEHVQKEYDAYVKNAVDHTILIGQQARKICELEEELQDMYM